MILMLGDEATVTAILVSELSFELPAFPWVVFNGGEEQPPHNKGLLAVI